jgi:multisubunit Na+/H+ antiporter MnhC subunit
MVLAADTLPAAPVLVLMTIGVLVAIGGHLYGSKGMVAFGIGLLFFATAAMVVSGYIAFQNDEPDIREERDPREPGF